MLLHQIIMQVRQVLESGSFEVSLGKLPFPCKNGAKQCQNGMHTVPPPRIFTQVRTTYNVCTFYAWLGLAVE